MPALPAMHRLLGEPSISRYETELGRDTIKVAIARFLDVLRASPDSTDTAQTVGSIADALEEIRLGRLEPVVNATGIILHTNLGRAPLPASAIDELRRLSGGYSNLEYDLSEGRRGSRYGHVAELLRELTGAHDAVIVNNCAAAVLLVLDTFAKGREVIVARSQLIEIGGGFRLPEVLSRSGATLVEVGTTNRVYLADFESGLSPRTALLLLTHPSNYRIEGFTEQIDAREIVDFSRRVGIVVTEDLGGGALVDLAEFGLRHERTVQEAVADGIGLVTFSGDKLLGGPQAGIIVGRANLIGRLRNNPLLRALRVDKMTLAALRATLQRYRDGSFREQIPIYRLLSASIDELRRRAEAYVSAIGAEVVESDAYLGGGALPQARLPSIAVAIAARETDRLAAELRRGKPAIVARIEGGRLLLDLRTIQPCQDADVIAALVRLKSVL